eukprot:1159806-Pelagomonas_calceolata.AAC.1
MGANAAESMQQQMRAKGRDRLEVRLRLLWREARGSWWCFWWCSWTVALLAAVVRGFRGSRRLRMAATGSPRSSSKLTVAG